MMKRLQKCFRLALIAFAFAIATNNAFAQDCYQIKYITYTGDCYCTVSFSPLEYGACQCEYEPNGQCYYLGAGCQAGDPQGVCGSNLTSTPQVLRVDRETIRQIAAVHPRFAAIIATLGTSFANKGIPLQRGKAFWAPIELKAEEAMLYTKTWQKSSDSSKKIAEKIKQAHLQGIPKATYIFFLEETSDSSFATLRLVADEPAQNDPPYTLLVIELVRKSVIIPEWGIKSWRIS